VNFKNKAMRLSSPVFKEGEEIPTKYTCEGLDISPPLHIEDVPEGTLSLVLFLEDPDAPSVKPFVHWVVFNIPPDTKEFKEGEAPHEAVEGMNTTNAIGYMGPCPPSGTHRYQFKLYAVNKMLNMFDETDRKMVLREIEGSILAQASLTGVYQKQKTKKKSY
jgi:hypothetical protein